MVQPKNEVVQALQQTTIDAVISSELERAVLLAQHMPAPRRQVQAAAARKKECCKTNFLNPAKEFELPQLTRGL